MHILHAFLCAKFLNFGYSCKCIWHSKSQSAWSHFRVQLSHVAEGYILDSSALDAKCLTVRLYHTNKIETREIIFLLDSVMPLGIQMWTIRNKQKSSFRECVRCLQAPQIGLWLLILLLLTFLTMLLFLCPSLHYMCFLKFHTSCVPSYTLPVRSPSFPWWLCGKLPNWHFRFLKFRSMRPSTAGFFPWDSLQHLKFRMCTEGLVTSPFLTALPPWLHRHPEHSLLLMALRV